MYPFIYWIELSLTRASSANNTGANDASIDKGKGKGKVVEADDNMEDEEEEQMKDLFITGPKKGSGSLH